MMMSREALCLLPFLNDVSDRVIRHANLSIGYVVLVLKSMALVVDVISMTAAVGWVMATWPMHKIWTGRLMSTALFLILRASLHS